MGEFIDGDALAWFCIEQLLEAIRHISPSSSLTSTESHLHRLHMVLMAAVSSVSLVLLPRVLEDIKAIIRTHAEDSSKSCKNELIQSLFKNISENVGDAEKEYVMRWWQENRHELGGYGEAGAEHHSVHSVLSSRL